MGNDIQFGAYKVKHSSAGVSITIENFQVDPENDFWLPLAGIGLLHFTSCRGGFFELDDIRPAYCPMQDSEASCKHASCPQPGET